MSFGDWMALANLCVGIITLCVGIITLGALYIGILALRHTATPQVDVAFEPPAVLHCGNQYRFKFKLKNHRYWYAKPTAKEVQAYFNFPPEFELLRIYYGSTQSRTNNEVKDGKREMKYLEATGIVLAHSEDEEVHVEAQTPSSPGEYSINVTVYPANGNDNSQWFKVVCTM